MSVSYGGDIRSRPPAAGFTLAEMILAIVVISVGLAGVLAALNQATARSADPILTKQSVAIAEAFIAEVKSKEFSNPTAYAGSPSQAERINFADVDDYNGYPSDLPSGGIYAQATPASGSPIAGLERYRVSVAVAATTSAIGPAGEVPAGQMKRITVTVTDPAGNAFVLQSYVANF